MNHCLKKKGFTFIELLAAICIISIIVLFVSYPFYTAEITALRRIEGKNSLLQMANLLERYYSHNNTYVGATLAKLGLKNSTEQDFYYLLIDNVTLHTYNIKAIPKNIQAKNDRLCASFTLNHLGERGITGTKLSTQCW